MPFSKLDTCRPSRCEDYTNLSCLCYAETVLLRLPFPGGFSWIRGAYSDIIWPAMCYKIRLSYGADDGTFIQSIDAWYRISTPIRHQLQEQGCATLWHTWLCQRMMSLQIWSNYASVALTMSLVLIFVPSASTSASGCSKSFPESWEIWGGVGCVKITLIQICRRFMITTCHLTVNNIWRAKHGLHSPSYLSLQQSQSSKTFEGVLNRCGFNSLKTRSGYGRSLFFRKEGVENRCTLMLLDTESTYSHTQDSLPESLLVECCKTVGSLAMNSAKACNLLKAVSLAAKGLVVGHGFLRVYSWPMNETLRVLHAASSTMWLYIKYAFYRLSADRHNSIGAVEQAYEFNVLLLLTAFVRARMDKMCSIDRGACYLIQFSQRIPSFAPTEPSLPMYIDM